MNKLPSDYDDRLHDDVAIVGSSDVFHFVVDAGHRLSRNKKSGCGSIYSIQTSDNIEEKPIEEALDEGFRPCKQCAKWVRKMYDVAAYPCEICERLNILIEPDFHTVEIPHAQTGHKHIQVCAECRSLVSGQ